MSPWIVPALVFLGLILLYLEFLLPGGFLAMGAAALLLIANILIFVHHGPIWGLLTTLFLLILVTIVLRYWMANFQRSFFGRRIVITNEVGEDEYLSALPSLVGQSGRTTMELHPSGKALINGQKYDVVSLIGSIPAGTPIKVVSTDGLRIMVSPMEE